MGHHSCTCCCAHDNAQPKNTPGNTGFLKEYRRILLSALLLFGGIAMKAMNISFFSDNTVVLIWYLLAYLPGVTRTERGMGKYSAERCFQ